MQKQYLTRKQVAEMCLVATSTVRAWQRKGMLTAAYVINKHPRFLVEDVENFLSNNKPVTL